MSLTKNYLIDTTNNLKVETLNLDTPLKAEQKRQSKIKADKFCRHLKGLDEVNHIDPESDDSITIIHCALCGVEMTSEMLAQRRIDLKKFYNKK